jgi:hypothetical protein
MPPAKVAMANRVPVTLPVHQAVGVHLLLGLLRTPGAVAQPHHPPLVRGGGERGECLASGGRGGKRDGDGDGLLQGLNPPAHIFRDDPLELRERTLDGRRHASQPQSAGG